MDDIFLEPSRGLHRPCLNDSARRDFGQLRDGGFVVVHDEDIRTRSPGRGCGGGAGGGGRAGGEGRGARSHGHEVGRQGRETLRHR